jgi:hypothetical protein
VTTEHDPLCPASDGPEKCRCPFITRIRDDQHATSYRQGRAAERHELWKLLEPVVTTIALRNGAERG